MNHNQLQALGFSDLGVALDFTASGDEEDTRDTDQCHPTFYGTKRGTRGALPQFVERTTDLDPLSILLAREAEESMLEELMEFGEVMGLDPEAQEILRERLEEYGVDQTVGLESVGVRVWRNPEFSITRPKRNGLRKGTGKCVVVEMNAHRPRRPASQNVAAPVTSQSRYVAPPPAKSGTHGKPRVLQGGTPGAFGKHGSR